MAIFTQSTPACISSETPTRLVSRGRPVGHVCVQWASARDRWRPPTRAASDTTSSTRPWFPQRNDLGGPTIPEIKNENSDGLRHRYHPFYPAQQSRAEGMCVVMIVYV